LLRAPVRPGEAVVRATSPSGAFGEARIRIVAPPARRPVPAACAGDRRARVASKIGRLCARHVRGTVLTRVVPKRSGRLRLSVRRGSRVLKRCFWRARAGRAYGCRFRVEPKRGLSVMVAQRRLDGRVLTRRLRLR
jgi:hypothetical protein